LDKLKANQLHMQHFKREENNMKLSARNQLKGKVISIKEGSVNGIVTLELPGGQQISATISMASIEELGLAPGKEAYAIIKATSVMVGVDG
jgi:molybdopterin-binding protein